MKICVSRQKSQFELVNRGKKGWEILKNAAEEKSNQFARIHGIWGIGQLAAKDQTLAAPLVGLLRDGDAEIITQSAKILGEIQHKEAANKLTPLLESRKSARAIFCRAGIGPVQYAPAVESLLNDRKK